MGAATEISCQHHAGRAPQWRCRRCRAALCDECVLVRQMRGQSFEICGICEGVCQPFGNGEMPPTSEYIPPTAEQLRRGPINQMALTLTPNTSDDPFQTEDLDLSHTGTGWTWDSSMLEQQISNAETVADLQEEAERRTQRFDRMKEKSAEEFKFRYSVGMISGALGAMLVTFVQSWAPFYWLLILGGAGAVSGFFMVRSQADNFLEGILQYGLPCAFLAGIGARLNGGTMLDAAIMVLYPVVGVAISSFTDHRRRWSRLGLDLFIESIADNDQNAEKDKASVVEIDDAESGSPSK